MDEKQNGSLAVAVDGLWPQDMGLYIKNLGLVRLVACGCEPSGMYLHTYRNCVDEADMFCSIPNPVGKYSKIEMSQSDYEAICNSVPKEKRGSNSEIKLPSQAEDIIKRLIRAADRPRSFY